MAQHNSLMEWLAQTKRVNKSVDQICMQTIDAINNVLPYLRKETIIDNKNFFDRFCDYYHKPNPVDLVKKLRAAEKPVCVKCSKGSVVDGLNRYVQGSIDRCWTGIGMVQTLYFEIIDFMFERPELVSNSAIFDEYISDRIEEVCLDHRKLNPLKSDVRKRFGKFYKDKNGRWRPERRKRF